ncbi:MAG: lipoprotein insertase outer membrane protein LolB [Ramlibacter sp.]
MSRARPWAAWLLGSAVLLAAGCATQLRTEVPAEVAAGPWSGRMALQVEGNQSQSFAAAFELKGTAREGELALFSPLGGTLAVLAWAPGSATLRASGESRSFESVEALVTHTTGAAIPVGALFDWLRGVQTPAPGWQADLSQLGNGKLRAERLQPLPRADLRVALDR